MTLTEEQKEMIRKNRERALEIKKRKLAEKTNLIAADQPKEDPSTSKSTTSNTPNDSTTTTTSNDDKEPLEEFEKNAPPTCTKHEAMKIYCLPEGTLAVCSFSQKDNPRRKGWNPMKLYNRAEIRRRARERYGGLEGLIAERKKREGKRLKKDLAAAEGIFD